MISCIDLFCFDRGLEAFRLMTIIITQHARRLENQHASKYARAHTHIHPRTRTHAHTHTHTHTHTNTYVTCVFSDTNTPTRQPAIPKIFDMPQHTCTCAGSSGYICGTEGAADIKAYGQKSMLCVCQASNLTS